MNSPLTGPVRVIGCGLIGTSVGLALRRHGLEVQLEDLYRTNVDMAVHQGAGTAECSADPQLVVVAVPPAEAAACVMAALEQWPEAVVTDVASIKSAPLRAISAAAGSSRYVGGHPMAGSEQSGPMAATGQLFEGRAWAVTAHETSTAAAVALVSELARLTGATVVEFDAATHDEAVALVSHLPHLMSVLAAAQLREAPSTHLSLAGPGLRDVIRIAGSETALWTQILRGNADRVRALLINVREDLDSLIDGLADNEAVLSGVLDRGRFGNERVPGKHGAVANTMATIYVQVPDRPGELSRLMAHTGESGINIEDIRIDHDPGRLVGLVEVVVLESRADDLVEALSAGGWLAHR